MPAAFTCRHQPLRIAHDLARELEAAYQEPQRAYHNMNHIAELLGWFDTVADDVGWRDPAVVYAAIVFHDAIYVPGAKDNEARSADWARRAGFGDEVARLIEMTADHGKHSDITGDAALFLDCDMAIVGAPPEAFDAYDAAIAAEYAHVPRETFLAGRATFLRSLARRPRIFLTDYFHAKLDAQARANLGRTVARLATQSILVIARRILSGDIDALEGCRSLVRESYKLPDEEQRDPNLLVFAGIDSELDDFPDPATRRLWDPAALAEQDRQQADYLQRTMPAITDACTALVAKLTGT